MATASATGTALKPRTPPRLKGGDLPEDVLDIINNTPKTRRFEVRHPFTEYAGQILKTDILSFQTSATLILNGVVDFPFIVVIARKVVFNHCENEAIVSGLVWERVSLPNLNGSGDFHGKRGADGSVGGSGGAGGRARSGYPGKSFDMPQIYFVAFDIEDIGGLGRNYFPLRFVLDGVRGGNGGNGGNGGRGGDGGPGRRAKSGDWNCKRGPGDGGNGGPGSDGTVGGDAGNGGNGGDIYIGGNQKVLDYGLAFRLYNAGAPCGRPGGAGAKGLGGSRGIGAGPIGFCLGNGRNGDPGLDGNPGARPGNPAPILRGRDGDEGHYELREGDFF